MPFDVYAKATDNSGNVRQSASIRIMFQYPDSDPNGQLTISGRIRHEASAPGNEIFLPNALIKLNLNNQYLKSTLTDANGNYLFDHLSFGGRYQIIPSEPGYEFGPPSVFFEGTHGKRDMGLYCFRTASSGSDANANPRQQRARLAEALRWPAAPRGFRTAHCYRFARQHLCHGDFRFCDQR